MKLPPLSLDLRRAALVNGKNHLDIIASDESMQVVGRINLICGSYDHASEIVDRVNRWPAAISALRGLAIIPTMAHAQNVVIHDGFRCRVCRSMFKIGAAEIHSNDCPLKGTEP